MARRPIIAFVSNHEEGFEEATYRGAALAAAEYGVDLAFHLAMDEDWYRRHYRPEDLAREGLPTEAVDGFVLAYPNSYLGEYARGLYARGFPVVQSSWGRADVPTVEPDNAECMEDAVAYLTSRGHRIIAHAIGLPGDRHAQERLEAYRAALQRRNLPSDAALEFSGKFNTEFARLSMPEFLSRRTGCTAIIAANDESAIGVMRGLAERGLSVPDDIEVLGVDNTTYATSARPSLTTFSLNRHETAYRAVSLLARRILKGEPLPLLTRVKMTLVERESTRSARRRTVLDTQVGPGGPAEAIVRIYEGHFGSLVRPAAAPLVEALLAEGSTPAQRAEALDRLHRYVSETGQHSTLLLETARHLSDRLLASTAHGLPADLAGRILEVLRETTAFVSLDDTQRHTLHHRISGGFANSFSNLLGKAITPERTATELRTMFDLLDATQYAVFWHDPFTHGPSAPASQRGFLRWKSNEGHAVRHVGDVLDCEPERGEILVVALASRSHRLGTLFIRLPPTSLLALRQICLVFAHTLEAALLHERLSATNAALEKSRATEAAASRAKSEFLSTISHELRTPLNGVLGMASVLRDTALTPEQTDFVQTILNSADALSQLIEALLDFSRLETGEAHVERSAFELLPLLEGLLDEQLSRAENRGLDLSLFVADEVPAALVGDRRRLREILGHLLANAVKFTPAGEIHLAVEVQAADLPESAPPPDGCLLRFSVRDTGIGIPQGEIERIFQPFTQMDSSITRRYGGAGLGLALCQKLVRLLGGRIWCESEPGLGSRFHVCMPFTRVTTPGTTGHPVPSGPRPTLLVVDDNGTLRMVLRRAAERAGFIVEEASGGVAALGVLQRMPEVRAVFLDNELPGAKGTQLLRAVKDNHPGRSLALFLFTSASTDAVRREISGLASAEVISKPLKPSHLARTLLRLREQLNAATAAPTPAAPASGPPKPQVLIVDDDAGNLRVCSLLLKHLGYECDTAAGGPQALAALERRTYPVVLLDLRMPDMDGFEVSRHIRARWPSSPPYIIALTADALADTPQRCMEVGMNDYLPKPVSVRPIDRALRKAASALQLGTGS